MRQEAASQGESDFHFTASVPLKHTEVKGQTGQSQAQTQLTGGQLLSESSVCVCVCLVG